MFISSFNIYILIAVISIINLSDCSILKKLNGYGIVNGKNTTIEEHPFQVQVERKKQDGNLTTFGSGVIISDKHILTDTFAFYSDEPMSLYQIRAGSTLSQRNGTVVQIASVIIHSTEVVWQNYMTIFVLENPLQFSSSIQPIAIPDKNARILPVGTIGTVSGWGWNVYREMPEVMQTLDIPIETLEYCYETQDHAATVFCAGDSITARAASEWDGGCPFVVNNLLYGIFYYKTRESDFGPTPGLYFRVAAFNEWIRNVTKI